MALEPGILARGPWQLDRVAVRWRDEAFEAPAAALERADAAIGALRDRGSPAHDGLAARLVSFEADADSLELELEPIRWALRLDRGDASQSVAAQCVVRSSDGRWLAGRRASWLATWAGRWALGAGGSVDSGENPADTLARELHEEWSVRTERITAEALVCLPHQLVMLIGLAWLEEGVEVTRDAEHDTHAWWPAAIDEWPPEADEPLRYLARMLSAP
ncbi:MAG TPA: NUDIX domain-containing protein [Solirubrobacteraceae bacterium]|jgi:8-oxo-dGTP pyrophosphatase MutT (NUDIX family)|nr:NUDIX domain-containing protein [Solirubrobacteraceae bacterium]